jgi:hypothetical protein
MGTIIGRSGHTIRNIQVSAGVRLVAQKEFLPQSTERQIVMYGSPEAVQGAVLQIGKHLVDDCECRYILVSVHHALILLASDSLRIAIRFMLIVITRAAWHQRGALRTFYPIAWG